MTWVCTNCGMPWKQQNKRRCGVCLTGTEAERWPPLDGFMVLEVDPDKPEEQDLAERDAFFSRKRTPATEEPPTTTARVQNACT